MDDLLDRIQSLEQHVQSLRQQTTSATRRLRWWRGLAGILVVLSVFSLPLSLGAHKPNHDDDKGAKGLAQRIRALERKLQHVTSVIGPDGFPELVVTGANLRIVNGLGRTDCGTDEPIPNCPNGLGNLIVGYNELRRDNPFCQETPLLCGGDIRTGSHNVVVGRLHNFSSFGGMVVGDFNQITGRFSVVSGGTSNTASGNLASVSAGFQNIASGDVASISGGAGGTASGFVSSVSGGNNNTASGPQAWVGGGNLNKAEGGISTACGGQLNTAAANGSTACGGHENRAGGAFSSVSGGLQRTAAEEFDWVAGALFQNQ
jgi:hypothetical protein